MHKETILLHSGDGKRDLRCYLYTPDSGEPRAVLQISHGMCEYIERYESFIEFICSRGFAVCGNDHAGHGVLAQSAGTLGYFAEKDGWRLLPDDLHTLTLHMKASFPGKPYFLLGHSMGSFVARLYLQKYGNLLTAAVIMGTSGPNPAASAGIVLAGLLIRLRGGKYQSPFLEKISTGSYNRRFLDENDKNSWLSTDRENRNKYAADPLCTFHFTVSGHRDLFTLLQRVSAPEWAESVPKELPLLLTSGGDDPVGDYGKGVEKVASMLRGAGVQQVSVKLYDHLRHEILNETGHENVYEDIVRYLEAFL